MQRPGNTYKSGAAAQIGMKLSNDITTMATEKTRQTAKQSKLLTTIDDYQQPLLSDLRDKATPRGMPVSGPADFKKTMRAGLGAGGFRHYLTSSVHSKLELKLFQILKQI